MNVILVDSCIVIDFIKNVEVIKHHIAQIQKPCINFIIEMELLQGAKDKRELRKIEKELSPFDRLAFNNEIACLSTNLIKEYALSHNLQIADSIIAATSLVYNISLFTHNKKDFRFIPGLEFHETAFLRDDKLAVD